MKNKLLIISAPSGAGKSTLCQKLLEEFHDKIVLSISSTTRAPRTNEKEGVNYFFTNRVEFLQKLSKNEFVEWAEVHGNLYGTSKEAIDQAFKKNKSVLLEIDVQGAAQIHMNYPSLTVSIFVSPPNLQVLEERLRLRATDSEEVIQTRLENAKLELGQIDQFQYHIINENLNKAYQELRTIIVNELGIEEK